MQLTFSLKNYLAILLHFSAIDATYIAWVEVLLRSNATRERVNRINLSAQKPLNSIHTKLPETMSMVMANHENASKINKRRSAILRRNRRCLAGLAWWSVYHLLMPGKHLRTCHLLVPGKDLMTYQFIGSGKTFTKSSSWKEVCMGCYGGMPMTYTPYHVRIRQTA